MPCAGVKANAHELLRTARPMPLQRDNVNPSPTRSEGEVPIRPRFASGSDVIGCAVGNKAHALG